MWVEMKNSKKIIRRGVKMEMCNKWGTLGGVEKVIRDEGKSEVVHLSF